MDDFFKKYTFSEAIEKSFRDNVKDEDFYSVDNETIINLLKHDLNVLSTFITMYNLEKESANKIKSVVKDNSTTEKSLNIEQNVIQEAIVNKEIVEEIVTEENAEGLIFYLNDVPNLPNDDLNQSEIDSFNEEHNDPVESHHSNIPENFTFTQNSLYFLLKEDLDGEIILGTYKNTKILLVRQLKNFIIKKLLTKDLIHYTISTKDFLQVKAQLLELFPTLKTSIDSWFKPHHRDSLGNEVRSRGCLYNSYKNKRKELKRAGIIPDVKKVVSIPVTDAVTPAQGLESLKDTDRSKYDIATVSNDWQSSFSERQDLLVLHKNGKTIIRYETYLSTFSCLKPPFGVALLELDFRRILIHLAEKGKIPVELPENFDSILSTEWPRLAKSIIKIGKSSRIGDVKHFLDRNQEFIVDADSTNAAAFLLLPLLITVPKTIKQSKSEKSETIKKIEISSHFIQHIQNEAEVDEFKTNLKQRLENLSEKVHPFIIICGNLNNISKVYVVMNDASYECLNVIKAVETCFKISAALHCWSNTCDYVWHFIQHLVYKLRSDQCCAFVPKEFAPVLKFIDKIDKVEQSLEE